MRFGLPDAQWPDATLDRFDNALFDLDLGHTADERRAASIVALSALSRIIGHDAVIALLAPAPSPKPAP